MSNVQFDSCNWLVLARAAFTFTFVVTLPQMSLPVLFDEISAELGLSRVQVGWIWGMGYVMGILVGLIGGPAGDRCYPQFSRGKLRTQNQFRISENFNSGKQPLDY